MGSSEELTLQVDSEVMEDESAKKYWGWPIREDGDRRAENSRLGPMTESTAVVRREPGAEPYRVRPVGPMGFWDDKDEEDGYMSAES